MREAIKHVLLVMLEECRKNLEMCDHPEEEYVWQMEIQRLEKRMEAK